MEEKKLSEQESLAIIHQMIQVAKDDHSEKGDGWLIWGWLLFAASVLSIIFEYANFQRYTGFVWSAMLLIGLVAFILANTMRPKREKVKTYVQVLLERLGIGFFISLFALIAGSFLFKNVHPTDNTFPFGYYYILYAFWMFIHGSAIHFRPLIIGAIVNWIAGIAMFMVTDFQYDMMISAFAILTGYLIPGYLLRAEYKKRSAV
ncbi:MAG TPA: hypothetical protein VM012_00180 [Flavitalea sp.]|nr:hypothetical protein [Flavitalea sp.]